MQKWILATLSSSLTTYQKKLHHAWNWNFPKQSLGNDERTNFKITSLMMKKYLAAFKEKPLGLKWYVEKQSMVQYGPVRVEELEQHTDDEAGKWVWKTWTLSTQLLLFQKHVYHSKMRKMDTFGEVKHIMLPWSSKPSKSKQNENHVSFQVLGTWTLQIELKALSPPSTMLHMTSPGW